MKELLAKFIKSAKAKEIKKEYNLLLSAGITDSQAEEAVISYYSSGMSSYEQGIFFVLFALIQWDMGRLSQTTYATASQWLRNPAIDLPCDAIAAVMDVLDSPMPDRQEPLKPRVIKCPWQKGTLLAYRISTYDAKRTNRFWNKYILLRVVEIKKWPLSAIKPDIYCDESMYVSLYHWVGDSIPAANVIENLKFTPIAIDKPMGMQLPVRGHQDYFSSFVDRDRLNVDFDAEYSHYVYALDWGNKKKASAIFTEISSGGDAVMSCNFPARQMEIPPLIGPAGFDIVLIKRLEQLFPEENFK